MALCCNGTYSGIALNRLYWSVAVHTSLSCCSQFRRNWHSDLVLGISWYVPGCTEYILQVTIPDCVEKFCVLHSIALNHGMGSLHWNSKKYIKIEFWYTWHIHNIYHVYTAAQHIHGIYQAYTDYKPHRGSKCQCKLQLKGYNSVSTQFNNVCTIHEMYIAICTQNTSYTKNLEHTWLY